MSPPSPTRERGGNALSLLTPPVHMHAPASSADAGGAGHALGNGGGGGGGGGSPKASTPTPPASGASSLSQRRLACVKSEIHNVLSTVRLSERGGGSAPGSSASSLAGGAKERDRRSRRFKEEVLLREERPTVRRLKQLHELLLQHQDLEEVDATTFMDPFLEVLRQPNSSGVVAGVVLSSLNKLLLYGCLTKESPRAGQAVNDAVAAVAACKFEASVRYADEVVLMQILEVLVSLLRCPVGDRITDRNAWEMVQTCFRMAENPNVSELLRAAAANHLSHIVLTMFGRAPELMVPDGRSFAAAGGAAPAGAGAGAAARARAGRGAGGAAAAASPIARPASFSADDWDEDESLPGALPDDESATAYTQYGDPSFAEDDHPHDHQSLPAPPAAAATSTSTSTAAAAAETEPLPSGYSSRVLVRVLKFLARMTDPQHNGETARAMGLQLINIALETGGESLGQNAAAVTVLQDDLCKFLLQNSQTDDLAVLALTLRVVYNLFAAMKGHLKVQLEVFLTSVHFRTIEAASSADEKKELALESLLDFAHDPALMLDLHVNYDCDIFCSNLFEGLCKLLCRTAVPASGGALLEGGAGFASGVPGPAVSALDALGAGSSAATRGLTAVNLLALDGVMAIVSNIAARCQLAPGAGAAGSAAAAGGTTSKRGAPSTPVGQNLLLLSPAGESGLLALDADELIRRKVLKRRLGLVATQFNKAPMKPFWREYARELGVLKLGGGGSASSSSSAVAVAAAAAAAAASTEEATPSTFVEAPTLSSVKASLTAAPPATNTTTTAAAPEPGHPPPSPSAPGNGGASQAPLPTDATSATDNDEEAREVAKFLLDTPGLDKGAVGDFVSARDPFCERVLHEYLKAFPDFGAKRIDDALRSVLERFRIPGEAQKIERVMEAFATAYFEQIRGRAGNVFASRDAVFIFSFSIVMLHTDAHSASIPDDKRMTLEQFINNNRGINDGANLSREFLTEVYEAVRAREFMLVYDPVPSAAASAAGGLAAGAPATLLDAEWDGVLRHSQTVEGARFTHADQLRGASAGAHERDMASILFEPALLALDAALAATKDGRLVARALRVVRDLAKIAGFFSMDAELNRLLIILCRRFAPGEALHPKYADVLESLSRAEVETDATEAEVASWLYAVETGAADSSGPVRSFLVARCAAHLARAHGNVVREAWTNIVAVLLGLSRVRALPPVSSAGDYLDETNLMDVSALGSAAAGVGVAGGVAPGGAHGDVWASHVQAGASRSASRSGSVAGVFTLGGGGAAAAGGGGGSSGGALVEDRLSARRFSGSGSPRSLGSARRGGFRAPGASGGGGGAAAAPAAASGGLGRGGFGGEGDEDEDAGGGGDGSHVLVKRTSSGGLWGVVTSLFFGGQDDEDGDSDANAFARDLARAEHAAQAFFSGCGVPSLLLRDSARWGEESLAHLLNALCAPLFVEDTDEESTLVCWRMLSVVVVSNKRRVDRVWPVYDRALKQIVARRSVEEARVAVIDVLGVLALPWVDDALFLSLESLDLLPASSASALQDEAFDEAVVRALAVNSAKVQRIDVWRALFRTLERCRAVARYQALKAFVDDEDGASRRVGSVNALTLVDALASLKAVDEFAEEAVILAGRFARSILTLAGRVEAVPGAGAGAAGAGVEVEVPGADVGGGGSVSAATAAARALAPGEDARRALGGGERGASAGGREEARDAAKDVFVMVLVTLRTWFDDPRPGVRLAVVEALQMALFSDADVVEGKRGEKRAGGEAAPGSGSPSLAAEKEAEAGGASGGGGGAGAGGGRGRLVLQSDAEQYELWRTVFDRVLFPLMGESSFRDEAANLVSRAFLQNAALLSPLLPRVVATLAAEYAALSGNEDEREHVKHRVFTMLRVSQGCADWEQACVEADAVLEPGWRAVLSDA